nr:hypothetical protein [Saprospiraceae bacterium]
MQPVKLLVFLGFTVLLFLGSCQKEEFTDSMDADITFSTDTLRFDTVFTERATITRFFKIYNKNDKAVKIKDIHLEEANSFFRFNIDGFDQSEVDEVIVWANDSIYVFVEATIDPDLPVSSSPFIIEDKLVFNVNGNIGRVVIEAFGQNANYVPARDATGGIVLLSCGGGTVVWDDPKPYVIFGVLVIEDCTLIWPAGTSVHVHGGIAREEDQVYNDGLIYVGNNGQLRSEGVEDNPVIVQGDRLEPGFAESRGQWSGIRLASNSGPHHFQYTEIK